MFMTKNAKQKQHEKLGKEKLVGRLRKNLNLKNIF
jgi:hypothetical protein